MNTNVSDTVPLRLLDQRDAFSAAELGRLVMVNRWLVAAIVVATTILCAVYAFVATPMYSADAVLKVDFPNPNALGVVSQGQEQVPSTLPTNAEIQLMQSRLVLAPLLKQFKLDTSVRPHRVPLLGAITDRFSTRGDPLPAILGLSSFAWGGEDVSLDSFSVPPWLANKPLELEVIDGGRYRLSGPDGRPLLNGEVGVPASADGVSIVIERLIARPGTKFAVTQYSEAVAIDRFKRNLKVSESGTDTGVVQVVYENDDPERAQAIANGVVQSYIASHIARRREEATRMREFINTELPRLSENLKKAEADLSRYRTSSNSMAAGPEASSYLQGSIDLDRQIAMLQVQKAALASAFTSDAPQMAVLDRQLALLQKAKGAFEARFNALPAADRRATELMRNAKVAQDIYVAMVSKSNELAVMQAGTLGNVHVVDMAVLPAWPFKPKRALIIAAGAAGGLIISVLFLFFRRQWSPDLENPRVVERHLHLPVFGTVLFSDRQADLDRAQSHALLPARPSAWAEGAAAKANAAADPTPLPALSYQAPPTRFLLSADGRDDLSIEALRRVRASLQLKMSGASNNVLAITGATPGTGKSFVSANLAVLSAQAGKSVLLIDGDLRRGRLAVVFQQHDAEGLAEVLAAKTDARSVIRRVGVDGLSFIAAGRVPANPSGLLSTPRLQQLIEDMSDRYDLVIIDTPPVLAVSAANMIASIAGSSVIVVRPNAQSERELEETIRQLVRTGACVIGVILNGIPRRRSERYSYEYATAYAAQGVPQ